MVYKNKYVSLLLGVALCAMQGCATQSAMRAGNDVLVEGLLNEENLALAQEIGAIEIDELYTSSSSMDGVKHEYRVIDQYTAASGRQCRKVEIRMFKASTEASDDILCLNKSGTWFWPRDVIYK